MYLVLLLVLAVAAGTVVSRVVYKREVDSRPGLVGLSVLALGALLGELTFPGSWQWLGFAGANRAQLDVLRR